MFNSTQKAGRRKKDGSESATRESLRAAAAVFSEHGYAGATVRDICRRAGANVAMIRYFFGSKEGLYMEVCRWIFEEELQIQKITARFSEKAPAVALRDWIDWIMERILSDREMERWALGILAHERSHPTHMTAHVYRRFWQPNRRALEKLLRAAMPANIKPAEIAWEADLLLGYFTALLYRTPPWDQVMKLPSRTRRAEWWRARTDYFVRRIASPVAETSR